MLRLPPLQVVAGVLLSTLLAGCSADSREMPEYRVGVMAILNGARASSSGNATRDAALLAAQQINEAGGIDVGGVPHRLRVIVAGHQSSVRDVAAQARRLINRDGVHALVGPQISAHAIPVARIAEDAGVLMVTPMSTNPETTAGKSVVFRVAFLDDLQAAVIADVAREHAGASTAAMLYDVSSTYSRDLARMFEQEFEARGGDIVTTRTYTGDQAEDFTAHLEAIRAADPDVLFLPNYAAIARIQARQAHEVGIGARLLGTDTWNLGWMAAEAGAEGAYATHQWSATMETPEARAFRAAYMDAYGETPGATAALTYDAVYLVAAARAEAPSPAGADVARVLGSMRDVRGASGTIQAFDGGNPHRGVVVSVLEGGDPRIAAVVTPG